MDELRIGDAEREDALRKLGDHLAAGRLDIDEHSERSSRILAARTRGDVRTVFADLPAPHPDLGYPVPASAGDAPPERARRRHRPSRRRSRGSAVRTFAGELTAVIWIVSIVFLVATRVGWWVILVPIAYSALLSAWGKAAGDHRRRPPPPEPEKLPNPDS
jgi:uncharacterized protein DUF1707